MGLDLLLAGQGIPRSHSFNLLDGCGQSNPCHGHLLNPSTDGSTGSAPAHRDQCTGTHLRDFDRAGRCEGRRARSEAEDGRSSVKDDRFEEVGARGGAPERYLGPGWSNSHDETNFQSSFVFLI
jgi:hypothetical protein